MSYTPMLFAIDCLPFDKAEMNISKMTREAILSYITTLDAVEVKNLQVAKTKFLLEEDEKLECGYNGEINGYSKRLKEVNLKATAALDDTRDREAEITKLYTALIVLEENLDEKCSDDNVISENFTIDDSWKFLRTQSKTVDIESKWDISHVTKWTGGKCEWTEFMQERRKVHTVLKGKFMRGL